MNFGRLNDPSNVKSLAPPLLWRRWVKSVGVLPLLTATVRRRSFLIPYEAHVCDCT